MTQPNPTQSERAEILRLRAERDRYRKALEQIIAAGGYASPEPLKRIAREALDG